MATIQVQVIYLALLCNKSYDCSCEQHICTFEFGCIRLPHSSVLSPFSFYREAMS